MKKIKYDKTQLFNDSKLKGKKWTTIIITKRITERITIAQKRGFFFKIQKDNKSITMNDNPYEIIELRREDDWKTIRWKKKSTFSEKLIDKYGIILSKTIKRDSSFLSQFLNSLSKL